MFNIMSKVPELIEKYEEDKKMITERLNKIDNTLEELKELIKKSKKEG